MTITSFREMLLEKAADNARRRIDLALNGYSHPGTRDAMERANKQLRQIENDYNAAIYYITTNYDEES